MPSMRHRKKLHKKSMIILKIFLFSQTAFVNDLANSNNTHFGASIQLNKLYLLCEKDLLRVTDKVYSAIM